MSREHDPQQNSAEAVFGMPCLPGDSREPFGNDGSRRARAAVQRGTRVFRANPFRLMPSVFLAVISDRNERVTRIEVSDLWVYVTLGWHQTFLWHRGQVRFQVDPRRKTITVDSFGERAELSCPFFSRALMDELEQSLPNLI